MKQLHFPRRPTGQWIASIILTTFFLLTGFCCSAQYHSVSYLVRDSFERRLDYLRREFSMNKVIPPAVELECLTALSFYPELKTTHIIFRFGKSKTTMSSKPTAESLLRKRDHRTYIITINEQGAAKLGMSWQELNFNETIGWLGHELGHVLHYTQTSNGGIAWIGYRYCFARYKRKMERFTDQIAIDHHLGFPLYDGTEFTLNCSNANRQYKNRNRRFYLKPDEILHKTYTRHQYQADFDKTKFTLKQGGLASMK
ncbi:hypothetical protein [Flavihumibacter petaseus]|uniref:Uncharacterized protein n=1 Tax=Flavihumibacter petaseus NBRC 106054 TaxID=1220578 RepID=A0A0E9N1N9_9BACT|nr:hypothetical protein [Flavihumibacter petaseus]GAO43546.1 hypothetical protein FPE01S_02_06510 [Flavihumibacter petaseus NBRC 106054]